MRKRLFAVAVLAPAVFFACPKPRPTPEPDTPELGFTCPSDTCPDGGANCLDVEVLDAGSGNKQFKPQAGSRGWKMCRGQSFVLESQVARPTCIDFTGPGTSVVARTPMPDAGVWASPPLDGGLYCVAVCWNKDQRGTDCSEGCNNDACPPRGPDTIRGNLDVSSKDPGDLE